MEKAEAALEQKRLEYSDMLRLQEIIPVWSQEFENGSHEQKKVLLSKIIEKVIVYPDRIEVKLRVQIEDFLKGSGNQPPPNGNGGGGENNYICPNRFPYTSKSNECKLFEATLTVKIKDTRRTA